MTEQDRNGETFTTSYSCTSQGKLEIPWPAELKDFDFLIATSTQPRTRNGISELTIQEIADHVPNREYLKPNISHGITTYRDDEILRALNVVKVK